MPREAPGPSNPNSGRKNAPGGIGDENPSSPDPGGSGPDTGKPIPDITPQKGSRGEPGSGGKNTTPGSGLSSPRDWGPITPRASGPEASIRPDEEAPYFMYVLPGLEPGMRQADIIADAKRVAEAAVSRDSVPMDYEDFVESYFLELMRVASPDAK